MKHQRLIAVTLAVISMGLFTAGAQAQSTTSLADQQQQRVDKRQERQAQRITRGVESGRLTVPEQARLEQQQRHINRLETRTEADGQVTAKEAVRMEKAQDHASRTIHRKKHNQRAH